MNQSHEDIEIKIESTWIEQGTSGFDRVVVIEYMCPEVIRGDRSPIAGDELRNTIELKLHSDLGLVHEQDYIFAFYDAPVIKDGKWLRPPAPERRAILRIKDEEHFAMFKLHYHGD